MRAAHAQTFIYLSSKKKKVELIFLYCAASSCFCFCFWVCFFGGAILRSYCIAVRIVNSSSTGAMVLMFPASRSMIRSLGLSETMRRGLALRLRASGFPVASSYRANVATRRCFSGAAKEQQSATANAVKEATEGAPPPTTIR